MDALLNPRIAELEHLRTVAMRDLEEAQKEIARLERELAWRLVGRELAGENELLVRRVAELEKQVASLTVSPVLPAVKPEEQQFLVEETGEWVSMSERLDSYENDNWWLKQENERLSKTVDRLQSLLSECRSKAATPPVACRQSASAVPAVLSWLFPLALCGVVLWATRDGSGWITFLWLLAAWNVGRFGPALLLMVLKGKQP